MGELASEGNVENTGVRDIVYDFKLTWGCILGGFKSVYLLI